MMLAVIGRQTMRRTIRVPGSTLKIGDIVIFAGMRYEIVTMPYLEVSDLTGKVRHNFSARPVSSSFSPIITFGKSTDCLWTVEA